MVNVKTTEVIFLVVMVNTVFLKVLPDYSLFTTRKMKLRFMKSFLSRHDLLLGNKRWLVVTVYFL